MARRIVDLNTFSSANQQHMQMLSDLVRDFDIQEAELHKSKQIEQEYKTLMSIQEGKDVALVKSLNNIDAKLALSSIEGLVPVYTGDARKLRSFLKSVEKVVQLSGVAPYHMSKYMHVVYRSVRGPISDYVQTYVFENPDKNWEDFKIDIIARFGEVLDPQTQLARMRHFNQRQGHSCQVFGQFLLTRACEIFDRTEIESSYVQKELISIFLKGLRNKKVAARVCDKDPETLEQAILLSREYEGKQSRLVAHGLAPSHYQAPVLARVEEDMEVDYIASTARTHASSKQPQKQSRPHHSKSSFTQTGGVRRPFKDGQPICYGCREAGHIVKNCPKKKKGQNKQPQKSLN